MGNPKLTLADWDGLPRPRRTWSIVAIWLAMAMAILDGAIANVALPAIARDIHAVPAEAVWVVNAYQLAIVVALLPMAALGEVVGYRRVFQAGLSLFVLASLACTLVHSLPALALARGVQGLGAAGVVSLNGALIRLTFPHRMLGRIIGFNALVISVGAATGPTVAAAILSLGPWQWLFALNLPIGAASLLAGWASLPESHRSTGGFDFVSAGLNVGTFGLFIIGVDMVTRAGAYAPGALAVALAVICGISLMRRSLSQARPLVPLDLLRNRLFALSVLTSIATFAAQMLAFVALPFYFEGALHRGQVQTGLLMTPWPVAVGVAAPLAGRLADHYPAAILGSIGLVVFSAGLVALALMGTDASSADIAWRMAMCGVGFGFFQAPNNRTLLTSAPLDRSGAAGAMLATARLTGQTIGATLTAILFALVAHSEVSALAVAAGFAMGALAISLSRLQK